MVFTATLASETPNPFDTVLGGRRGRWESLLESSMPIERLDAIKLAATEGRNAIHAAMAG